MNYGPQNYPGQPAAPAPHPQGATGQQQGATQDGPSDIIAKAAVRNKFLDFRNNLIPAYANDYAMVHGIGGKDHASRSTIKCLITDYGVKPSLVVSANINPELAPYILTVCEKNVGLLGATPASPHQGKKVLMPQLQQIANGNPLPANILPPTMQNQKCIAISANFLQEMESEASEQAVSAILNLARQVPALPDDGSHTVFVPIPVTMVQQVISIFAEATAEAAAAPSAGGTDFQYRQERVNVYKKENGLCPVSILTINRVGLRKGGEVSRLPWTVKIENFMAPAVEQQNGTTSYNSRGIQQKREAFVSLSDMDMYRCLYRVTRFIELWEMSFGIPLIKQGVAAADAAWAARKASYNQQ